jgi:hypothetical protein
MNRTVDVILGLTAAVATALLLALIARDDIGMPPDMVREDALIGASIMIAAVAGISSRRGGLHIVRGSVRSTLDRPVMGAPLPTAHETEPCFIVRDQTVQSVAVSCGRGRN